MHDSGWPTGCELLQQRAYPGLFHGYFLLSLHDCKNVKPPRVGNGQSLLLRQAEQYEGSTSDYGLWSQEKVSIVLMIS